MKNKWKIAAITGMLLTPAAIVYADDSTSQPSQMTAEENRALLYFKTLHIDSSLVDTSIYAELLNNAFQDAQDPKRVFLQEKLNYIQSYKALTLTADSLKAEISKLTLTNKTLQQDVENALAKYNSLSNQLLQMNDRLFNAKSAVQDPEYASLLTNISNFYENSEGEVVTTLVDIMARLIGASNQQTLITRSIQVENVFEKTHSFTDGPTNVTFAELVTTLNTPDLSTITIEGYNKMLANVKTAYATLSVDEKKIADAQVITGSAITFKQVITAADTNVSKAEVVDADIRRFESLDSKPTTDAGKEALKKQLVAIDKSYNSLTDIQKKLLSSRSINLIAPFNALLNISGKMGALKIVDGQQYRDELAAIDALMAQLPNELTQLSMSFETAKEIMPNIEKYTAAKTDIAAADNVEQKIAELVIVAGVTPELVAIKERRDLYTALTPTQKKLVRNLNQLTAWENGEKRATNVDKLIDAIVVTPKQDFYKKLDTAKKAYDQLNQTIEVHYLKKAARLLSLEYYANVVNQYNALKVTDPNYSESIATLLNSIATVDGSGAITWKTEWADATLDALPSVTAQDVEALKSLRLVLLDRRNSTEIANDLIGKIEGLQQIAPEELLATLVQYRAEYNRLDATAKKLVTNIKKLTEFEKQYLPAIKVVKLITELDPLTNDFAKKAATARTNYNKLNANMLPFIGANLDLLKEYERVSSVMLQIDNLKKSKNILADATEAKREYDRLITYINNAPSTSPLSKQSLELLGVLNDRYNEQLTIALKRDTDVKTLVADIERLAINYTSNVGSAIEQVAASYKALTSNDKKLVTNYNVFKMIEKNYKAAQKVYNQIENLPVKEADNYAKQVESALKAYQKLTDEQRKYVFNYASKLQPFVKVAALIGEIEALKPSMKDYTLIVQQLRARYNELSPQEKLQIYNYNKLEAAENAALGVQNVISLINTARPGMEKYLDALQKAREAYNSLSKDQQKQVNNYADLQAREKAVKPVLDLNDQISKIELQRTAKNFIKEYDKAWKTLDAISLQDRALLTNEKILTEQLPPIYNVISIIEAIKPSGNNFVTEVAAARAAYNALNANQKLKVLNLATLEEHEVNVRGGAYIDELIRAIRTSPKELYVQKVQEALEAYKNLSSANKKAVTLYDELKLEEKLIKPVVEAIGAIEKLSTSYDKVDAQVKKLQSILTKLTDEQLALVNNLNKYNALETVIGTINLIEQIKPSDTKYYIGNTKAAEISYNRLSPDDKQRVSNYSKLEEALLNVAALDQIIKKISELSYLSNTFADDVKNLLDEYKKLPSALKKQVTNYSVLETANKDIAAAQKVVSLVAGIDAGGRTFESKVLAARKAYIALNDTQKALVSNLRLLQEYERQLGL